jgi:hypothetical protein
VCSVDHRFKAASVRDNRCHRDPVNVKQDLPGSQALSLGNFGVEAGEWIMTVMRHRNGGAERDEIPAVSCQADRIAWAARQKQAPRRHTTTSRSHTSRITALLQRIGAPLGSRVDRYGQLVVHNSVHACTWLRNCKHSIEGKSLAFLRVIAAPLFTIPVFNF